MRRATISAVFGVFAALTLAAACGSKSSSATGSTTSGTTGSTKTSSGAGGDMTPADSCIKPGDPGNSKGVGAYCSPGGGQCTKFDIAGLCLADAAPNQHQWFCTRVGCKNDADCGENAKCFMDPQGNACVPSKCLGSGGAGGTGTGGTTAATGGTGGTGGAK